MIGPYSSTIVCAIITTPQSVPNWRSLFLRSTPLSLCELNNLCISRSSMRPLLCQIASFSNCTFYPLLFKISGWWLLSQYQLIFDMLPGKF